MAAQQSGRGAAHRGARLSGLVDRDASDRAAGFKITLPPGIGSAISSIYSPIYAVRTAGNPGFCWYPREIDPIVPAAFSRYHRLGLERAGAIGAASI